MYPTANPVLIAETDFFFTEKENRGQLGVPLTVYLWYLLCSLGILGDYNPEIHTV